MSMDPSRDERSDTNEEFERILSQMNHPSAPPLDDTRAQLGPNFTPTPFGWAINEVILGEKHEHALLLTFNTVVGKVALAMRHDDAKALGDALRRNAGGITVVDQ